MRSVAATPAHPRRPPMLLPFAAPGFALAWLARLCSLFGDQFQIVALAAFTLAVAERSSDLGMVLFIQAVPRTALMLAGGVVVDRLRPRVVVIATSVLEGSAAAALAYLALTGRLDLTALCVYALVTGLSQAFSMPGQMALVPVLLPRESVRAGNALFGLIFSASRLAGPPAAGLLVAATGTGPAFGVNAAAYLVAALLIAWVRLPGRIESVRRTPLRELADGLSAARSEPVVLIAIALAPVYTVGAMAAVFVGLPSLARITFDAGDAGVGLLLGSVGVGSVVGTLVAGAAARVPRQGILAAFATLAAGVALGAAALAPDFWIAVACLVVSGVFEGIVTVVMLTIVQTHAPVEAQGRVLSLYTLAIFGVLPISFAMAGVLGGAFGPPAIVLFGAASIVACGLLALSRREMRAIA